MFLNFTNVQPLSSECSTSDVTMFETADTPSSMELPVTDHGRRLLALARAGDTAGVRECMAGGAPFVADWLGNTPVHAAAAGDHHEIISMLLRAGGLRDARTKVDRTPLHVSCWLGHAAATRVLLAAGAEVGARDMLNMTPLHWAAQQGHVHIVRQLLDAGADWTLKDKFHLTPPELASRGGYLAIVDLIDAHIRHVDAQLPTRLQAMPRDKQHSESADDVDIPDDDPAAELLHIPAPNPAAASTPDADPPTAAASAPETDGATLTPELLLQRHGITMLGGDTDGTVLRALSNGRTVALSDAGKLMLKEASQLPAPASHSTGSRAVARSVPHSTGSSVVVRSVPTPTKGPVFTVNSAPPTVRPVRKVIHPKDFKLDSSCGSGRVKIVMNRANFQRLVASAGNISVGATTIGVTPPPAPADGNQSHGDNAQTGLQHSQDLATARSELETTRNQLETTRNELETTRNELETTRSELETACGELETTRNELETACGELETTRNELETTRDELETTRNELAAASNKLEQLESALRTAGFEFTEWDP